jgi:hypothetical protein
MKFSDSFRIVAWQMCYYAVARNHDLHPRYYCPTCPVNPGNDSVRDMENGCPKCPLTELFVIHKATAIEEIERLGGFAERFPIERLLLIHGFIGRMLYENQGRINPKWDKTLASVARIIIQEQEQCKRELDYEHQQKMKAATNK